MLFHNLNKECSTHKRSAMLALLGLLLAGAEPSSQARCTGDDESAPKTRDSYLLTYLVTYLLPRRERNRTSDKNLCRCFGAPARRVFRTRGIAPFTSPHSQPRALRHTISQIVPRDISRLSRGLYASPSPQAAGCSPPGHPVLLRTARHDREPVGPKRSSGPPHALRQHALLPPPPLTTESPTTHYCTVQHLMHITSSILVT